MYNKDIRIIRYGRTESIDEEGKKQYEVLEAIAESRACLTKGGGFDLARASKLLLDDFRGGKLGRITLEMPPVAETGE